MWYSDSQFAAVQIRVLVNYRAVQMYTGARELLCE